MKLLVVTIAKVWRPFAK